MARLEELHGKLEREERLTRTERTEMVALERELTATAAALLKARLRQAKAAAP